MIGGREKVGGDVVNVAAAAAGSGPFPQKNRRLTFPFGPEVYCIDGRETIHEHFIREIPIAVGALGCALWDGGLVLTRWLYAHGEAIMSKYGGNARVLELGCGVGLGGIMAAHFTKSDKVVLTDYIPDALDNCRFNVKLNQLDPVEVPPQLGVELRPGYDFSIEPRISVEYLDWDAEFAASASAATKLGASADAATAKGGVELPPGVKFFNHEPHSFDVIIGAELTYNLLSCESLAFVVDRYLAPDGVFHEVLSNDRDGVSVFVQKIEERGFVTERQDVPQQFVGNFGTRKWSKQDLETYSLYSWRRKKQAPADHDKKEEVVKKKSAGEDDDDNNVDGE